MSHQSYTQYLQKELDFLKLLVTRFHEQEKVAELELDIALLKAQDIYEYLLKMKLMPGGGNADEAKVTSDAVMPSVTHPTTDKKKVTEVYPQVEPSPKAEQQIPVEKVSVPVSIEVEQPKEKVIPSKEDHPATPKGNRITEQEASILAEKIRPAAYNPINETLAGKKTSTDLSSRLQTASLSNISSGIGVNDKFLYIRELFQGNGELYHDTIRQLDTAESLEDALNFLNQHFKWDKKNDVTQKFLSLLHRRHGKEDKK